VAVDDLVPAGGRSIKNMQLDCDFTIGFGLQAGFRQQLRQLYGMRRLVSRNGWPRPFQARGGFCAHDASDY
jgi:hypothetical protein